MRTWSCDHTDSRGALPMGCPGSSLFRWRWRMVRNGPLSIKGPGCQGSQAALGQSRICRFQISVFSCSSRHCPVREVFIWPPLRVGYAEMQEGSTRQGEVQCCHLEPWVMKFKYVYCSVKKRIGEWVHNATKRASVCVFSIHMPSGSCV